MPQDRLRKLTDDNRELAANLKRELTEQPPPRSAAKAATSKSRRGQGSDLGSGRGSEERHSSVAAGGRGTKRGKDNDIEKVGSVLSSDSDCYTNSPPDPPPNEGPSTTRTTKANPPLAGSEALSEDLSNGLLRRTPQLLPPHSISTRETVPSHQESSLLSNGRRGRSSRTASTSSKAEPFLTLYLPKKPTSPSHMTLREAGQAGQRKLMYDSSPGARQATQRKPGAESPRKPRKVQRTLQYFSNSESSDGKDMIRPPVRKQNRSSLRHAALANSSLPSSRDVTPLIAKSDTATPGINHSKLTGLEIVRDFLSPPDELEYVSRESVKEKRLEMMFAPLLGGTTMEEKGKIAAEIIEEEKGKHYKPLPRTHLEYVETYRFDQHNENRLMFFYGQNPQQRLAVAGVARDPVHLDPPGSKTPYDALDFEDRLVQHLNRLDADTVVGWDVTALKKIPGSVMQRLTPEALACMPGEIVSRLPFSIRQKSSIDGVEYLIPKSEKLDENLTKFAMFKLRDRKANGDDISENQARIPMTALRSCRECKSIGIKCNRDLPKCHACRRFGEDCTYDEVESFEQSFYDTTQSKYLGLDLTCPITQKHLNMSKTDHLGPRMTKTGVPSNCRPKPTFTTQPNVPKAPMRIRQAKHISLTIIWQALLDLDPGQTNFTGPNFPTIEQFYPEAPVEKFTYPYFYSQEESFHLRPSIRITIPDHLKTLLVDDWENVTKSLLLVPLPSKAPTNFIIDSYYDEEKGSRRLGSADLDVLEEFCAGMKVYFEKSIGKILLYRFERGQLAEVSSERHYCSFY